MDSTVADTLLELQRCQTCGTRLHGWVFGNRFERPRSQQDILRRYIKPAALRAGLGKIDWHTFRHSYSTLLRGLGTDIQVQQELLRHSTVQSTMNVYAQAISEQKNRRGLQTAQLWACSSGGALLRSLMGTNRH